MARCVVPDDERTLMKRIVFVLIILAGLMSCLALCAQGGKYAGIDNCKMCHKEKPEYIDWAKSAHSRSFELLVNVGQEKNAECLACHTTGYGKGGYVDEATTPGLKGVTCEACHGPSADHMGDKSKVVRTPAVSSCAGCHQKNNIHSLKQ